jgi:hypothetical protein
MELTCYLPFYQGFSISFYINGKTIQRLIVNLVIFTLFQQWQGFFYVADAANFSSDRCLAMLTNSLWPQRQRGGLEYLNINLIPYFDQIL